MIGDPDKAATTLQIITSSNVVAVPTITDPKEKAPRVLSISFFAPKRFASQGVNGMPMAPATTVAVTTQEISSILTDRSPRIWGSTALGMVHAAAYTEAAMTTDMKISQSSRPVLDLVLPVVFIGVATGFYNCRRLRI